VGTRYEDQPPEHWAGPESLDPTPVWKQFMLIGLFLLGMLAVVLVIGYLSLAAQLATPPALVAGNRLVLLVSDAPAPGAPPRRIGPPLVPEADAFWLEQPVRGEMVAVRARWLTGVGLLDDVSCRVDSPAVTHGDGPAVTSRTVFSVDCGRLFLFGQYGEPLILPAPRALDRYLVSVDGDRLIVNLSRVIEGLGRTSPSPAR
jgi:hypothetical protein